MLDHLLAYLNSVGFCCIMLLVFAGVTELWLRLWDAVWYAVCALRFEIVTNGQVWQWSAVLLLLPEFLLLLIQRLTCDRYVVEWQRGGYSCKCCWHINRPGADVWNRH